MPWLPLLAGCTAGVAILAGAGFSGTLQQPSAIVAAIRLGFVPVIVGLSFLLREPGRNLAAAFPAPGWLTTAAHLALATPVLAATIWIQFALATGAPHAGQHDARALTVPLPWAALLVELTAWCAITIAAAALVARSRWDPLGGAIAAPVTLALLTALGIEPLRLLPPFAATTRAARAWWEHAHQAWALLMLAAVGFACWGSRDRWSRLHAPRVGSRFLPE